MNKGLRKIDEALRIGNKELSHLLAGEIEEAEASSLRRTKLVREAGQFFQADISDEFKAKLIEMYDLQIKLTNAAKELHASLQKEFKEGKKQAQVKRGYNRTMTSGSTAIPIYMSRMS